MTDTSYRSTTAQPPANTALPPPRWYGIGLSILSAIIGLTFAWQTLVVYAFSTMVDPQIRGGDRAKMIADRFLFGDGPFQIVIVCMLIYLAATGLISAMLFSTFAIWRQPTLKVGTMISCSAGGLVTLSIVGCFLTR